MISFFAATLPMQLPNMPPAMSSASFLEQARDAMPARDVAALEALAGDLPSGHPFVVAWRAHETQLRNACARIRAARLGQDPAQWIRPHAGYDVALERGVAAAFQEPTPLRREQALDAIRWRKAQELAGPESISSGALLAYYLHLRIAEREAAWDPDAGTRRLRDLADPSAVQHDTKDEQ